MIRNMTRSSSRLSAVLLILTVCICLMSFGVFAAENGNPAEEAAAPVSVPLPSPAAETALSAEETPPAVTPVGETEITIAPAEPPLAAAPMTSDRVSVWVAVVLLSGAAILCTMPRRSRANG